MALDALSETLRVVRLTGAIFVRGRFSAPWAFDSRPAAEIAPYLEPDAERVVIYHFVTEGDCWVVMDDGTRERLAAGDVVLFPQGHGHRLASAPDVPPIADDVPPDQLFSRRPTDIVLGGGGAETNIVCGYMACDQRLGRMLLAGLPPLVRVNVRGSNAGLWLESSLRYALSEARSPRPGGAGVLAKLSELLFIEVLRVAMQQQSEGRTGWLAGLGDRIVGPALNAMHAEPARGWTLDALARHAHTSRSVLAERFQAIAGVAPMAYLTQWRMTLAASLLARSDAPLASIAGDVGYQTDTAFSRAFRREFGEPPAAWRRRQARSGRGDGGGADAARH